MFYYICRDLTDALRYLPFGIGAGVLCFFILSTWDSGRKKRQKKGILVIPMTLFFTYLAVMLVITFLSREGGNHKGLDLELFSTWGINDRNNAFVIENILLFVPYGIFCPLAFSYAKKFWGCLTVGALTSILIELSQLFTGRGYFQIDDILTNIIGTVAGFLLYFLFWGRRSSKSSVV